MKKPYFEPEAYPVVLYLYDIITLSSVLEPDFVKKVEEEEELGIPNEGIGKLGQ